MHYLSFFSCRCSVTVQIMFLIPAIVCMGEGVTLNCTATSDLTCSPHASFNVTSLNFFFPLTFIPQHSILFFLFFFFYLKSVIFLKRNL